MQTRTASTRLLSRVTCMDKIRQQRTFPVSVFYISITQLHCRRSVYIVAYNFRATSVRSTRTEVSPVFLYSYAYAYSLYLPSYFPIGIYI